MSKPQVRFHSYKNEWDNKQLSDLLQWNKEDGVSAKELEDMKTNSGDICLLSTGNFTGKTNVKRAEEMCHQGEIVTLPSGGTANIKYHNGKYINSGNLIGRSTNENNLKFIYYMLLKNNKRIQDCYRGSSIFHPDLKDVNSLPITTTKLEEQQNIAELLTNIDNILDTKKKELELIKSYKKTMLSKMFPKDNQSVPEIRFKGFHDEWKQSKISDISQIIGGGTPSTSIKKYWEPKEIPWLSSGEVHKKRIDFTNDYISSEGLNNSSAKWVKENSILIAMAGQGKTRGTVAITNIPITTNQSIAAITLNNALNVEFVFQNLESRYLEIRELSSGDGGRGGLNKEMIASINVLAPSKEEQEKIGEFFKRLDETILNKENEITSLEYLKATLLNKMFA